MNGNGIIRAAAFAEQKYLRAHSVIGADLSRTPLFANLTERTSQWSDKYLSASSGKIVIGVGYRHHQWRVIAELAPETLRDSVAAIAGSSLDAQLIVDQNGSGLPITRSRHHVVKTSVPIRWSRPHWNPR